MNGEEPFMCFSKATTAFIGGMGKSGKPPGGRGCCVRKRISRRDETLFCMETIWRREDSAACILGGKSWSEVLWTAFSMNSLANMVWAVSDKSPSNAESESAPSWVRTEASPMVEADGVMCLALEGSHKVPPPVCGLLARLRSSSSILESRSSIRSIFFSLGEAAHSRQPLIPPDQSVNTGQFLTRKSWVGLPTRWKDGSQGGMDV